MSTSVSAKPSGAASKCGCGCSPDSSTTNESSPLRMPVSLAVGSRKSATPVVFIAGKSPSPPARLRRHAASMSTANKAIITAAGTHQFAATQSIQEPDSGGGAAAGFFGTAGVGAGAEALSAGDGSGVAEEAGAVGAGGGAAATDGAGLVWAGSGAARAGAVAGAPSLR